MTTTHLRRFLVAGLASAAVAACSDSTGPDYPDLVITTTALSAAHQDFAYTEGLDAEGGDEAYVWTVVAGSLPPGLDLSVEGLVDNDAVITGTPQSLGTFSFTVQVESGDGQTATRQFSLEVLGPGTPLAISTPFLPPPVVGAPYDVSLRATGGTESTFTWSLAGGTLPAGLTLTAGAIKGTPTSTGTATITLRVENGPEVREKQFAIVVIADDTDHFNITTVEVVPVPDAIRPYFEQAVQKWESVITGDLEGTLLDKDFFGPEHCGGYGQALNGAAVEDILMIVDIAPIDGPGKVLGQAGPCVYRLDDQNAPGPSVAGVLTLDSQDLLSYSGQAMAVVISHEMGHVLGFGSLWDVHGLIEGAGTTDPRYTGTQGVQEWHDLGGTDNVPVEADGGEGTADSHWDEETFGNERMTGFVQAEGAQPLSRLSVGAMADLGYTVDLAAADPYTLPSQLALAERSGFILNAVSLIRPDRGVHPDGTRFRSER